MKLRLKFTTSRIAPIVGVLLGVGCGLLLLQFIMGMGLVRTSYDLLHAWRGDRPTTEAVLIYLDESSHQALGQPFNAPWDRALHARLVDRLTVAGARAVVFDIVFSDANSNNPAADEKLARAVRQNGRVVLAADTVRSARGENKVFPPFDALRDAAAAIGSSEMVPDPDLVVRKHTPREDNPLSSMAWVAASLTGAEVTKDETREDSPRWMQYYGPANTIEHRSYHEALDPSLVPDGFFKGKVVFVGARSHTKFSGDRKDEYANPFSFWLTTGMKDRQEALYSAGVEVQATAFLNLLRNDWLKRPSRGTEVFVILFVGLMFGAGLTRLHPAVAALAALAGIGLTVLFSYLFFISKFLWFPWLIVAAQIGLCLAWAVLINSVQLYVQKRLYEHTLRLYLPPKLVKKFAGSPELLKPGAVKQTVTLVFTDIADFTTLSEGMDPDELADMMNQYFQNAISKCIHRKDGTVAKYIGDAIFAFWNAPDIQTEHAFLACEAALLFLEQAKHPVRGRMLHTRIGIHTGVANVGNFGSEERVDYTALGDSVNLASRLEGLNKHMGTSCLISSATKAQIGDRLVTRPLGVFQVKGFEGHVEVYELVGQPEAAEETRPWRDAFAAALNDYLLRKFDSAAIGFRRVLELKPNDGPATFYLNRLAELSNETLTPEWTGRAVFKEK